MDENCVTIVYLNERGLTMKAYFEIQDSSHTSIYSVWKVAHPTLLSGSHTVKAIEIFKQSGMQQESESPYKVVLYLKNKEDLLPLRNIVIIALRRGTEISREHHCYDVDQLEEKHSKLTLEGNIEHILNMLSKNGILSEGSVLKIKKNDCVLKLIDCQKRDRNGETLHEITSTESSTLR